MRRKIAIGTLGLVVFLAMAMVGWGQDPTPPGADPGRGQGQHRFDGGGRGRFDGQRWRGGPGGRRMGWQRGGHPGFGGGGGFARLAENPRVRQYLSLTDDQVTRLHQISLNAEKASVQTRADMQLRRIELRELMRADSPDQSAILQKMDEVNDLRGKMEKARVQTLLSERSVLTADQIKKLKTFRENFRAGGPAGGQRRGPGGRPPGRPGAAPGGAAATPPPPAQ